MMEMFKIEAVWRSGGERKKVRRQSQQSDSRNSSLTAQSQYFTGGYLSVLNYSVSYLLQSVETFLTPKSM